MSPASIVEDIFLAALDKNTPEERAAFLDDACQEDADTRRRVERLLQAHPKAGHFLEPPTRPTGEETAAYVPTAEQIGEVIAGRYKLVEEIGGGGMGNVWVAQQTEPVKRVVAVKLIKAGMDSKAVLARFEAERQALALMEHPNIARVLDGGATPDGRPFFVMELVKGVPITKFCDARKLTPRQRLELFVPVCQAIQHAHQKGVIHRDIKPSNVLVALYDDTPVPKVIDFGIAKAAGQTLTEKTLMTGFGSVVGTPEYMSPEQASLNNLDIDTRSDVYSLGVLLYELLAGSPPFGGDKLKKAGLLEMLRVVREEEPPRPSTRLSTAEKLPGISADRGTEPMKLTGLLRNELDWIVMKALEKDRARRYETVNGFAADVQRYLAGEAVQAHPPSAAYRLRKFARKNRVALGTTAAFVGLLIASAAISALLATKAMRAEAAAENKRMEAEANAKEAKQNAEWAEKNAGALSETSNQLLATVIDAEIRAIGLKVDLDLAELRPDPKVGLLRLARPLEHTSGPVPNFGPNYIGTGTLNFSGHPKFIELREFAAAAVLAAGQNFAPLVPPITHDGQPVAVAMLGPDKQTLLTRGKDGTARLWDTRTARLIAVLRQGEEWVVTCGFSPDSQTVFTDDQTSVARFWDVPSGRFRAATDARPSRYDVPDIGHFGPAQRATCQINGNRLLTRRFVATKTDEGAGHYSNWEGPVELWDTETGRLVARLDDPAEPVRRCRFTGESQWIVTLSGPSTVVVYAARNGREVARLEHPGQTAMHAVASPSGRRIATIAASERLGSELRFWDALTWEPVSTPTKFYNYFVTDFEFIGEDYFHIAQFQDVGRPRTILRVGKTEPAATFESFTFQPLLRDDSPLILADDGQLIDGSNGQRLMPPSGQRFHPDLKLFSPDGRWVIDSTVRREITGQEFTSRFLLDLSVEKLISLDQDIARLPSSVAYWSSSGEDWIGAGFGSRDAAILKRIPAGKHAILPADLLELWAQVAVRGELGENGRFVKWDEPTWEKKRQKLAAIAPPYPDFPFPGYVATDKMHWLRSEYEAAAEKDKVPLANKLFARAEAAGDKLEAVRWRAALDSLVKPAEPAAPK